MRKTWKVLAIGAAAALVAALAAAPATANHSVGDGYADAAVGSAGVSDPENATGAPDTTGAPLWDGLATVPLGETLDLTFTDEVCLNGPGADLRVYEEGDLDPYDVYIEGQFVGSGVGGTEDFEAPSGVETFTTVRLVGTFETGDQDSNFDAVECLYWSDTYGKVSGVIGGNKTVYDKVKGPGDFAFQGWVAADQHGDPFGSISVNYKTRKESCTYVPNAGSSIFIANWAGSPNDGLANDLFLDNWSTSCVTGAFADQADIVLIDRSQNGNGPQESRGYIRIDADTAAGPGTYDVGTEGAAWPLDTGNVLVNF